MQRTLVTSPWLVEEALELLIVFVVRARATSCCPAQLRTRPSSAFCECPNSVCLCQCSILSAAVILFDGDNAKRAPFFHLLRRLGLVRVVKSLLGDGAKFGLSQVRSFYPSAFFADAYRIVECELTSAAISERERDREREGGGGGGLTRKEWYKTWAYQLLL